MDSLRESDCSRWKFWARCRRNFAINSINKLYMAFERQFYYKEGINGHDDWHHVVFTPSAWHNTPLPMPGFWKSLQLRDWENARVRHPLINIYRIVVLTTSENKQCGPYIRRKSGIRGYATRSWYCKLDKADFQTFLLIASYLPNLKVEREK